MADQPDGETCGEPVVIAVSVRTFDPPNTLERSTISALFLCDQHNFPAWLETP